MLSINCVALLGFSPNPPLYTDEMRRAENHADRRHLRSASERELIVVDDDPMVLASTVLGMQAEGWQARGFADPLDALMYASDAEQTAILVDLKIPGVEGLDLVSAFCALGRHSVILLSAYVDVRTAVDAMRTGVDNVLTKPASMATLSEAVTTGLAALDQTQVSDLPTFTRRERQVAELMVEGNATKDIAKTLQISPRTVEFFRASLLRKTQSKNLVALTAALVQLGYRSGNRPGSGA